MERKDFILILVVIILISGGYYLYSNNIWPFDGTSQIALPSEVSAKVYAISGVAKEVYDSVIVVQPTLPRGQGGLGDELMVVVNDTTSIFMYSGISADQLDRTELSLSDISVGDRLALTSDDDISEKQNGVFLASSIAVYR